MLSDQWDLDNDGLMIISFVVREDNVAFPPCIRKPGLAKRVSLLILAKVEILSHCIRWDQALTVL